MIDIVWKKQFKVLLITMCNYCSGLVSIVELLFGIKTFFTPYTRLCILNT